MQQRPPSLLGAAAVQAADAVIVLAASVLAGVDTIAGQSYQRGSGIALTLIGLGTAVALAWVAWGLYQARRWSRTPMALTQLFVGIVGVYLVQGHRYEWGIPSLALAIIGFALLVTPATLRALAGPQAGGSQQAGPPSGTAPRPDPGQRPRPARPVAQAKASPSKKPAAKTPSPAKPAAPGQPRPPRKRPARG
ncbi:MAG TPA: hypothetical protein VIK57_03690 [Streptosporangiaceae bacterium]